jgi:hypothetical protein
VDKGVKEKRMADVMRFFNCCTPFLRYAQEYTENLCMGKGQNEKIKG